MMQLYKAIGRAVFSRMFPVLFELGQRSVQKVRNVEKDTCGGGESTCPGQGQDGQQIAGEEAHG